MLASLVDLVLAVAETTAPHTGDCSSLHNYRVEESFVALLLLLLDLPLIHNANAVVLLGPLLLFGLAFR